MKSGLAAQVIAVEALRRVGFSGTIVQSAVPDEETVGVRNAGMGWLVEQGLIEADALIITEPFGPDGVGIGHKGAIWGEITIHGKQAHGSSPRLGVNAVEAMARYLARLDAELRPQLEQRVTDYGVTPDEPRSTLSFDTIHGGAATNIVPDRCTVTFNRRLIPGEDLDDRARGAARAARRPAATTTARSTPPSRCWWASRSLWCRPPAAPSATSAWSRGS